MGGLGGLNPPAVLSTPLAVSVKFTWGGRLQTPPDKIAKLIVAQASMLCIFLSASNILLTEKNQKQKPT